MNINDLNEMVKSHQQKTGASPDSAYIPLPNGQIFVTGVFSDTGKDQLLPMGSPAVYHEKDTP